MQLFKKANQQIPADELACLLNEPNNILAIEYLKAIQAQNAAITPYLIQRTGDGYHEAALNSSLSSATAIRKELLSNGWNDITTLNPYLPEAAYSILKEYLNLYPPVSANDFLLRSLTFCYSRVKHNWLSVVIPMKQLPTG